MSTIPNYYHVKSSETKKIFRHKKGCLMNKYRAVACLCRIDPDTKKPLTPYIEGKTLFADTEPKASTTGIFVLVGNQLVPCN